MSHSPPQTLGKYQIIREIARSNDIVYEAYDPVMNRRVAVKELAVPGGSTMQQQQERLRRFLREAKAAGSLAHPNVVTIFEVGEDAGRHFLAMEFLDGHTLRNELDTHGFLEPKKACEVACEVLEALAYAHKNGVIHRDIKPDNIQLLSDGRVKLTDFGIARLTFEPNLTIDGQVFGTPSYMSPEQVVGKEIDARSDLFSVGVILYEMLSGQKPFAGDSVVAITYSILNKEPDRPSQVNFALWQTVQRALDKSPSLRYASAEEMSKAIQESLEASLAGPVLDYQPVAPPTTFPTAAPLYPPTSYGAGSGQQTPTPSAAQQALMLQMMLQGLPIHPKPPRKPLLTPGAKVFLARLFVAIVVSVTAFALVVSLLNAFFGTGTLIPTTETPQTVAQPSNADEYAARGRQAYLDSKGMSGDSQAKALAQAANDLQSALRFETDRGLRQAYGDEAALALYDLARIRLGEVRTDEARRLLIEARALTADVTIRAKLDEAMTQLP